MIRHDDDDDDGMARQPPLQMDLRHINSSDNLVEIGINLKDYYPSVEWDIISVPAERHQRYYECCPNEFYPGKFSFWRIVFFVSIVVYRLFSFYILSVFEDDEEEKR